MVVFCILSFVFGLVIGYLIKKDNKDFIILAKQKINNLEQENKQLLFDLAEYKARNENIKQQEEDIQNKYKILFSELFKEHQKAVYEEQNKTIFPVKEEMENLKKTFDDKMLKMTEKTFEAKTILEEQFKLLQNSTGNLQKEASELANALKNKKTQGNWGEFQLERIFEILDFKEGREYRKEVFVRDESGQALRPDYVLDLPNQRKVVIDSKLSLESYIKYKNSDDENDKRNYLKEFVIVTKRHIDILSSKEYQNKIKGFNLDYVIMFMPIEHAFLSAVESDSTLYQYAFDRNIAFATPSLLLPILRTIDVLFKIEKRDKNIDEVIVLINKLYEKYVSFTSSFDDIGKKLDLATKSYDVSKKRLSSGDGNMSKLFNKIQNQSGISSNKTIALEYDKDE